MPEYLSSILSDFSYVEFNRYNQPWLIAGSTFMHDPSYHAEYTQKYMTIFSASGDIKIVNQNLQDKLEISSNNVVMLNNVDICNNLTVSNKIDASNIVLRDLSSNLATINYSTITSLDVSLVQSIDNRIDVSAQLVYLNKNLTVVDTIDASQIVLKDLSTNLAKITTLIVTSIQNSNTSEDVESLLIGDDGKVSFNQDVSFIQNVTVDGTLNVGLLNLIINSVTGTFGTLDIGDVLLDISNNLRRGYFPEAVIGYDIDDNPDPCIKAIITSLSGENVEISNNVFVKNRIDASFIEINGIRILDPSQFSIGSESGGSTSNIINFPTGLKIDKDISATNIEASNNLFVKNRIDASFIEISGIRILDPSKFSIGSDSGGSTTNIINFPTGLKIDKDISATNIEASNNLFVKNNIDASFIDVSGIRIRDPAQFSIGTSEGGSTSNKIAFPTSMSVGGDLEITGDLVVDGEKMVNPRVQFARSNTSKLLSETFKHTDTQKFYSYYDGSSNTDDLSLDNIGFIAGLNVLFEEDTQTINLLSGEIYSVLPDFSGATISRLNDSIYKVEDNKIIIANPTLDNEKERYRVNVSSNFNFSTSNKNSTKLEVALLKHDTSKNTIEIIERASSSAISKTAQSQDNDGQTDSSNIQTKLKDDSFDRFENTSRDISNLTVFYHPLQDRLYLFEISNNSLFNKSYNLNNGDISSNTTAINATKINGIEYIDGTSNYTTNTIYNPPDGVAIQTNLNYNYFPPRSIDLTEWTTTEYTTNFPQDASGSSYNHNILKATTTINSLQYKFITSTTTTGGTEIWNSGNKSVMMRIFNNHSDNKGVETKAGFPFTRNVHGSTNTEDFVSELGDTAIFIFGKTLPNDTNVANDSSSQFSHDNLARGPYIHLEFPYPVALDYFEKWSNMLHGADRGFVVIVGSNFTGEYSNQGATDDDGHIKSEYEILDYIIMHCESNNEASANTNHPNYTGNSDALIHGMGALFTETDRTTGSSWQYRHAYPPDNFSIHHNYKTEFSTVLATRNTGLRTNYRAAYANKYNRIVYYNFNPELKYFKQYTIQFTASDQGNGLEGVWGGGQLSSDAMKTFTIGHMNFRYVDPVFGIPRSNGLTFIHINDFSINNFNITSDALIDFSDNNLSQLGGFKLTDFTGDLDNVVYSYKYNVIATLSQSSTTIKFINNRYDSSNSVYNVNVDLNVDLNQKLDKLYNILAIDNRDIFLVIGKKNAETSYRLLILDYDVNNSIDNSGNVTGIDYFRDYPINKQGDNGITFSDTDLIKILYISEHDTFIIYKENTNLIYYNNIDTIITYITRSTTYIDFFKVDTNILDGSINHIYWFHELDILIIDKVLNSSHIYDIARIIDQKIIIISENINWKYNFDQETTNATRKTNNIIYSPNTGKLFRVDVSGEIIQTRDLREFAVKTSIVNILDSTTTRKTKNIPGENNRLELGWVSTLDTSKNQLWTISIPYDINIYKVYDGPDSTRSIVDFLRRDDHDLGWRNHVRAIKGNQRDNIITMNAPVTGNMIKRLTGWSIKCYDLSSNSELLDKIIVSNDTYLNRDDTIDDTLIIDSIIRPKILENLHTSSAREGVLKITDMNLKNYNNNHALAIGENRFCNWDIIDFWSFSYLGIKYIKSKNVLLLYGAIKDISQVRVPNTTATNQVINYSDMSLVDFHDVSGYWCHSLMSIELDDNNSLSYNILDTYSLYRDGGSIDTQYNSYRYDVLDEPEVNEYLTYRWENSASNDFDTKQTTITNLCKFGNTVLPTFVYNQSSEWGYSRNLTLNNSTVVAFNTLTKRLLYDVSSRKMENIQLCEYIDDKDLLVVIGHEWQAKTSGYDIDIDKGNNFGDDEYIFLGTTTFKSIKKIFIKTYYEITKNGFTSYIKQTFDIDDIDHFKNTADILDVNLRGGLSNTSGHVWAGGINVYGQFQHNSGNPLSQPADQNISSNQYMAFFHARQDRTYTNMQYYRKGVYNYRSLPCSSCFCSGWFNNGCLLLLHDDGIIRTFKLKNVAAGGLQSTMWTEDTTDDNIKILYTYLKQVSGIIDLSSRVIKCEYLGQDINEVVVIGERNLRLASLSFNSSDSKIKLSINTSLTSYQQASALLRLSNQSIFSNHFAEDISNVLNGYSNTSYGVVQNSFGNSLWIEDLSLLLLTEFDGVYYDLSHVSGITDISYYSGTFNITYNMGFEDITDFQNSNNKQRTKLIAYNVNSDGNLHRNSANRLASLDETIGGIEYNSETRELIILTRMKVIRKSIINIVNTTISGEIADPDTNLNINFNKDVILSLSNELLIGYLLRNEYSQNTAGLNRQQTASQSDTISNFNYTIGRENFKFNIENYAQANFTSIKADQVDFSGIPIQDSVEYTNLRTGFLYQTLDGTIKIKRS